MSNQDHFAAQSRRSFLAQTAAAAGLAALAAAPAVASGAATRPVPTALPRAPRGPEDTL
jgi:hypothetical protein